MGFYKSHTLKVEMNRIVLLWLPGKHQFTKCAVMEKDFCCPLVLFTVLNYTPHLSKGILKEFRLNNEKKCI